MCNDKTLDNPPAPELTEAEEGFVYAMVRYCPNYRHALDPENIRSQRLWAELQEILSQAKGAVPSGISAADNDPLPAMWAERNRLEALATEADIARDDSRRDELDEQRIAIEERMPSIRATTVDGVLAQVELLRWRNAGFEEGPEDELLLSTIRAGLLTIRTLPALPSPAGGDDAELFAAERELGALRSPDGDSEALDPGCVRATALERKIAAIAPATLAGAAVKLRQLADPITGIEIGANYEEAGSIRQVLALIEREAQP